jgi:hypothetical protein
MKDTGRDLKAEKRHFEAIPASLQPQDGDL